MAKKECKYTVDWIGDECVSVLNENAESVSAKEVKKRKVTMYDYGHEHGFCITPASLKRLGVATVRKIKAFPNVIILESKNRFNIRLSFDKAGVADAERIAKRDLRDWFEFLQERLQEQALSDIEEAKQNPTQPPHKGRSRKVSSAGGRKTVKK